MLEKIIGIINRNKEDLHHFATALWKNPETAYKEFLASEEAAKLLENKGFSVIKKYCGIETAFRCEYENGSGPVFAIAAEYDALPEIGHGCGHNLICAAG